MQRQIAVTLRHWLATFESAFEIALVNDFVKPLAQTV
jgi:hypothetical protein